MLRFIPSTPSSLGERPESPKFEFGYLTPESPYRSTSPADHLFLNGKLLPHEFPIQIHPTNFNHSFSSTSISRTTSRAGSVRSRDSLLSSRSNSTNSRSSSCSSARTTSSDSSERKLLHTKQGTTTTATTKLNLHHSRHNSNISTRILLSRQYQLHGSSSQRWQNITVVPSLSREGSRRRSSQRVRQQKKKKEAVVERSKCRVKGGLCRQIVRSFWETCMKCHALEPSKIKEDDVLKGKLKLQHKL